MPDHDDDCVLQVSSRDGSPISIVHKGDKICFVCNSQAHPLPPEDHPRPPVGMRLHAAIDEALDRSDHTVVRVVANRRLLDLEELHPAMRRAAENGRRVHLELTDDE